MAEAVEKFDENAMNVPEGGIADFIDAEYEDDEDGVEEYGDEGIAQFPALTKKMAAMGREGDDNLAHVETGELIIPAAFFEDDPELKEMLFERFREMGVENPERYVVGSGENSIHPDTGAYEFFFKAIKKFVKGVGKAIKKVVKGVVKVIKKIAPVVLPIALSFTPLGPVYGAALGSGIGTLINGGSVKDALKSALISGATGAVFSGFTGSGSFGANVKTAIADPLGRMGQTISGAQTSLSNVFGGEAARAANAGQQTFFSDYVAPVDAAAGAPSAQDVVEAAQQITPEAQASGSSVADPSGATTTTQQVAQDAVAGVKDSGGFMENIKDAFTPGGKGFGESMSDAFFPAKTTAADVLTGQGINPVNATASQLAGAKEIAAAAAPGFLRTYGPLAAVGTGAAAAAGMFETPEMEEPGLVEYGEDGQPITGEDLIAADPGKYLVKNIGKSQLNEETGQYEPITNYTPVNMDLGPRVDTGSGGITAAPMPDGTVMANAIAPTFNPNQYFLRGSQPGGPFARPVMAAEGGPIYPRRNGGIMPNEGVPGEDSVRAMLMPGEFVMTTDAVRGLGNGNLNQGIQNMYSVMRNLESRGRQMA